MQEVLRLKKSVTKLLQKYGNEPNDAIATMELRIVSLETALREQLAVTKALQDAFQTVTKPLHPFKPASENYTAKATPATPVKTFGKILPEEQLVEPVGRQGRGV